VSRAGAHVACRLHALHLLYAPDWLRVSRMGVAARNAP